MYTARIMLSLVDFIFGLIELLIGLRIILRLFGANAGTPFVRWIYDMSDTLLTPFRGIFPSASVQGGFILDISAIVALFVYALIAYLISELIRFLNYNSTRYYTTDEEVVRRRRR